jgi:hypothetical protein
LGEIFDFSQAFGGFRVRHFWYWSPLLHVVDSDGLKAIPAAPARHAVQIPRVFRAQTSLAPLFHAAA